MRHPTPVHQIDARPVSLLAESVPMKIQPKDYVGEIPIGDGHYTFVLVIRTGLGLDIRLEKDN